MFCSKFDRKSLYGRNLTKKILMVNFKLVKNRWLDETLSENSFARNLTGFKKCDRKMNWSKFDGRIIIGQKLTKKYMIDRNLTQQIYSLQNSTAKLLTLEIYQIKYKWFKFERTLRIGLNFIEHIVCSKFDCKTIDGQNSTEKRLIIEFW